MKCVPSVTFYFMKNSFSDSSRKCILPNMIGAVIKSTFFLEYMPAVFASTKSTVKLPLFVWGHTSFNSVNYSMGQWTWVIRMIFGTLFDTLNHQRYHALWEHYVILFMYSVINNSEVWLISEPMCKLIKLTKHKLLKK